MHTKRIEKLQAMLRHDRYDGVMYADSGNMQYFLDDPTCHFQRMRSTGYGRTEAERAHNGHFMKHPDRILFIPAEGEPTLVVVHRRAHEIKHSKVPTVLTHYAVMADALTPFIRGKQRIAVGESCDAELRHLVAAIDNTIGTPDGERYGERLRLIKDAAEIEKIRAVAAFTDAAMGRITKALVPGITPAQVKAIISQIAVEEGCADISFDPGVIYVRKDDPGAHRLFSCPPDAPLREDTAVGFDYGFIRDGYCSDYGRSFYCGNDPKVREAYDALMDAQLHLLAQIKPGAPLNMCYDVLYKRLEGSGWAKHLRKHEYNLQGHQIGINVHERPWLRDDEDEAVFQPGMVFCLEPKIWWPGRCYLRCEDMVLVTETGCESLTKYDRGHFELG